MSRVKHQTIPVEVDEEGRVFSARSGKQITGGCNGAGYLRFSYRLGGRKTKTSTIHRVVAECLVPNPEDKPTVNHKDGNKTNNHPDNLEWATFSENTQHAYDTGLNKSYERRPADRARLAVIARTHKRGAQGWCIA